MQNKIRFNCIYLSIRLSVYLFFVYVLRKCAILFLTFSFRICNLAKVLGIFSRYRDNERQIYQNCDTRFSVAFERHKIQDTKCILQVISIIFGISLVVPELCRRMFLDAAVLPFHISSFIMPKLFMKLLNSKVT